MQYDEEDDLDQMSDSDRLELEGISKQNRLARESAAREKARAHNELSAFRPMPSLDNQASQAILARVSNLMVQALDAIDAQIEQHALGLRLLQPPHAGKLDIRWWKVRGGGEKIPVMVKWEKDARRAGRLQPRVLKRFTTMAVAKTGPFELNHKPVLELALALNRLIQDREMLRLKIRTQFGRTATQVERTSAHVGWLRNKCCKEIAKGLNALALDGTGWTIPDSYKTRLDYEKIAQLTKDMEKQGQPV